MQKTNCKTGIEWPQPTQKWFLFTPNFWCTSVRDHICQVLVVFFQIEVNGGKWRRLQRRVTPTDRDDGFRSTQTHRHRTRNSGFVLPRKSCCKKHPSHSCAERGVLGKERLVSHHDRVKSTKKSAVNRTFKLWNIDQTVGWFPNWDLHYFGFCTTHNEKWTHQECWKYFVLRQRRDSLRKTCFQRKSSLLTVDTEWEFRWNMDISSQWYRHNRKKQTSLFLFNWNLLPRHHDSVCFQTEHFIPALEWSKSPKLTKVIHNCKTQQTANLCPLDSG